MNFTSKILFLLSIFICILLINSNPVNSVDIGVSPGALNFDNMLRGGYAERTVVISISSDQDVKVKVDKTGDIVSWLNLTSEEFTVSRTRPFSEKIIVRPPLNVGNGIYTGKIRFVTEGLGVLPEESAFGTISKAAVEVNVRITITDQEIRNCRVNYITAANAEKGDPIKFSTIIANDGNVILKPLMTVEVWDVSQTSIVKYVEFHSEEILPTVERTIDYKMDTADLDISQYWAEVEILECNGRDTLTFDVLEEGALASLGNLKQILNTPWAKVNENIVVTAIFENTGLKDYSAQFKGTVQVKDKIVEILESEELTVEAGSVTNFTMIYTPKRVGKHLISGRVFYDKKRTFEKSSILNINSDSSTSDIFAIAVYALLIIVILFLIIKINRARKKRKMAV